MYMRLFDNKDVSYIDDILYDASGRLRIVPSATVRTLPADDLRLWLHFNGVYGLPTTELVDFLHGYIDGRGAIEIGAGNGALGRALGIPSTDSYLQTRPDIALYYRTVKQPTISYGADVIEMDAATAVEYFKPDVVIASWVTQLAHGTMPGCAWGIDEKEMLLHIEEYILFGSLRNHGSKEIWPPDKIREEDWMCSRAPDSALFFWRGQKLPQEWSDGLQVEGYE